MAIKSDTPLPVLDLPLLDPRILLSYHLRLDDDGQVDPLASDVLDAFYQDLTLQQAIKLDEANKWRPDLLAQQFYGDARLAWVIMLYNGATSASQFEPGIVVRIPNKTDVLALLSKLPNRSNSRATNSKVVSL